jgi:dihydrofolate synthase/folylpolyglutamate synthase
LTYNDLEAPLAGDYTAENVRTVLAVVDCLLEQDFEITLPTLKKGLKKVKKLTGYSGRWEVLSQAPLTIADCAHNADSLQSVLKSIKNLSKNGLHIVLGTVEDKDLSTILPLLPQEAIYYYCQPDVPRGSKANRLKQDSNEHGLKGESYPSCSEALKAAQQAAEPDDVIFVGGSTFVVSEILSSHQASTQQL